MDATSPDEPASPAAEPAAWRGTAQSRWALPAAGTLTASAVLLVALGPWGLAPLLLALAAASMLFRSVTVRVAADGLRASPGTLRWTPVHLRPEQVTAVEAVDVRPREWGGWGYRGSLRLLGRAGWVLRAGPGIRVRLDDGKVFVVTVDDAAAGAAAMDALLSPNSN